MAPSSANCGWRLCFGIISLKQMNRLVISLLLLATLLGAEARPKVALVLGGGGAKGAAEVGVLKYIEKAGVPIDMIVGTSIGSVVGGLYSVGYRADTLDVLFRSQEWIGLLTDRKTDNNELYVKKGEDTLLFGIPLLKGGSDWAGKLGAISGDSIVSYLGRLTGRRDSVSFDSLPIPYRCVTVDIKTMKEVSVSAGHLPMAMRASMAIPLAFKPVRYGRHVLVDGGVLNNLPVDVARKMGADYVIAIDVTQNKPGDSDGINMPSILKQIPWLGWLANRPDRDNYKNNVADADIYINPRLDDCSVISFNKVDFMIAQGEKSGKAAYKDLVKLRKRVLKR